MRPSGIPTVVGDRHCVLNWTMEICIDKSACLSAMGPVSPASLRVNRRFAGARIEIAVALIALLWLPLQIFAQEDDTDDDTDPSAVIEASENATADADIERRLRSIYTQIEPLSNVDVRVQEGVIFLSGSVSNDEQARRALNLAARLEGVVTVDDDIDRTLDVQGNVAPIIEQFNDDMGRWLRALPLFLLAVTIFLVISLLGHQLAKWNSFWNRVSPNPFLGELLAQAVRIIAILVARTPGSHGRPQTT